MNEFRIENAEIFDADGASLGTYSGLVERQGVVPENTPPVGGRDVFTVTQGESITVDVLLNDSDADGDALFIAQVTGGAHGTAALNEDDTVTYTPAPDFSGSDMFVYELSDGQATTVVEVEINITPTAPNDDEAAEKFIAELKATPEVMPPMEDPARMAEHMASMALVPRSTLTHAPVKSGDWFDPGIWWKGEIPGDGARVVIPEAIQVVYDGENDAAISWLRISGHLKFHRTNDTRLVVETLISDGTGFFDQGTQDDPVLAKSEIVIADSGDISLAYDPTLLSRCLMTHGKTRIHGQEKLIWSQASSEPMAGDTAIDLQEVPLNWAVGDRLVITGTHKLGFKTTPREGGGTTINNMDMDSEDEAVTLTGIDGQTVSFDPPLQFNHERPVNSDTGEAYPDFCAVGNLTSNIVIRSANPDLSHRRGHTMFMHQPDVDVNFCEFRDLGRTDKRVDSRNINDAIADPEVVVGPDFNAQTRYSVHFHHCGLDHVAFLRGVVINGSNGWGAVNHQSNVIMDNNCSFNVWGCHFVGEDGNELGCVSNCLIVKAGGHKLGGTGLKGIGGAHRDIWRNGEGIGLSGRMLRVMDNYIAGTGHGISWNVREAVTKNASKYLDVPETAYEMEFLSQRATNIQCAARNVFFCMERAYIVIKRGANQEHDHMSWFEEARAYEVSAFAQWDYTSKYLFDRCLAVRTKAQKPYMGAEYGMMYGVNSFSMITKDCHFDGFPKGGIVYGGGFRNERMTPEDWGYITADTTFVNCGGEHVGFNTEGMLSVREGVTKGASPTFEFDTEPVISFGNGLSMAGTITDTFGPRKRTLRMDGDSSSGLWSLNFWKQLLPMMQTQGVMRDDDGNYFFDLADPIADQFDNEEVMLTHRLPIEGLTQAKLDKHQIPVRPLG